MMVDHEEEAAGEEELSEEEERRREEQENDDKKIIAGIEVINKVMKILFDIIISLYRRRRKE